MVRYVSLLNFTDRGIAEMDRSVERSHAFRSEVEALGGKVVQLLWGMGEVDGFLVFEAPDEKTGASLMLKLGSRGFVRSRTLRVFDESEFAQIIATTA